MTVYVLDNRQFCQKCAECKTV